MSLSFSASSGICRNTFFRLSSKSNSFGSCRAFSRTPEPEGRHQRSFASPLHFLTSSFLQLYFLALDCLKLLTIHFTPALNRLRSPSLISSRVCRFSRASSVKSCSDISTEFPILRTVLSYAASISSGQPRPSCYIVFLRNAKAASRLCPTPPQPNRPCSARLSCIVCISPLSPVCQVQAWPVICLFLKLSDRRLAACAVISLGVFNAIRQQQIKPQSAGRGCCKCSSKSQARRWTASTRAFAQSRQQVGKISVALYFLRNIRNADALFIHLGASDSGFRRSADHQSIF